MKSYRQIGFEIGRLVEAKQVAYGDSFGNAHRILETLYPKGIAIEQMGDALTITRIVDKLFRIANQKKAFDESPYRDIAGYALLAVKRDEDDKLRVK